MSRIGKKPVTVPKGVSLDLQGSTVAVKGPKGELRRTLHPEMKLKFDDGSFTVERPSDEKRHKALHGLTRTLVQNMVEGVSKGFTYDPVRARVDISIKMAGSEVFKVAVTKLGAAVDEALAANGLEKSAIQWLVPHQANIRIIQAMAKRLELPMDRVIVTVQDHGNTSTASVPLALDVGVRDGRVKRGDTILLEAFGGGFTWGSALIRY